MLATRRVGDKRRVEGSSRKRVYTGTSAQWGKALKAVRARRVAERIVASFLSGFRGWRGLPANLFSSRARQVAE